MKVRPKEVYLNVPIVLMFNDMYRAPELAANVNTILHGKVRMKYEELGMLGEKYVAIFYLQRNDEYQELRDEFVQLIQEQEEEKYNNK